MKASAIHLAISLLVALLAAALIFGLWYPWPYRDVSGGSKLFELLVSVDVVLGPLLTLAVFDIRKPRRELMRDLFVIGSLQLLALLYGTSILFQARPVYAVFEIDRFRVVSASDIDPAELLKAPSRYQTLPFTGPRLLAVRPPTKPDEKLQILNEGLQGITLATKASYWQEYDSSARAIAVQRAKTLAAFIQGKPLARTLLEKAVVDSGRDAESLRVLPFMSRFAIWTALVDERGDPVGYVPIDPF